MHFCVSKKCNYGKHYSPWRETHVVKQVLHSQSSAAQDLRPDIATWTEISWDTYEIWCSDIVEIFYLNRQHLKSLNRELGPLVAFGGGWLCGEVHQLAVELVRKRVTRKQLNELIVVLLSKAFWELVEIWRKLHCALCCSCDQTELGYVRSISKRWSGHSGYNWLQISLKGSFTLKFPWSKFHILDRVTSSLCHLGSFCQFWGEGHCLF